MLGLKKFEQDLKKAYLEETSYSSIDLNYEDYQKLNEVLSPLLFKIINSYYFDKQYKNIELTKNENYEEKAFTYKIKDPDVEDKYSMFSSELDENWDYKKNNNSLKINLSEDIIFERLKKIDPIYEILLEKDPLKQRLNLIKKNNLKFEWIYVENNLFETLNRFHKISSFKDQNHIESSNLENNLNNDCDLQFISLSNNTKRYFLIAHNELEIAGIVSLPNKSYFKDTTFKDNIKVPSYISVSRSFRGNGLAIKMFEKVIEKAKNEDWVIVRSSPSEDGKNFLETKIDNIVLNNNDSLIVNSSLSNNFDMLKEYYKDINNLDQFKKINLTILNSFKEIEKINNEYKPLIDLESIFEKKLEIIKSRNSKEINLLNNLKINLDKNLSKKQKRKLNV